MRRAALPLILLLLPAAGCQAPAPGPSIWFVHATDPHLLELPKKGVDTDHQEKLASDAFTNLLTAASLPAEAPARPSFLVLTGDLGLEALSPKANPKDREAKIKHVAGLLRTSPLQDIYFVLGNNDVVDEQAMGPDVKEAKKALNEISQQLGGQVTLHDLTSCYETPRPSSLDACSADVGAGYRLIGFPSYSFKSEAPRDDSTCPPATEPGSPASGGVDADGVPNNRDDQQKLQVDTFVKLMAKATADGKKVLVVTHIAELDDPYLQARELFARKCGPVKHSERPKWSAWDVSSKIFQTWQQQIDSDIVVGVLAGHFHDSHRDVYRLPYAWSARSAGRARKDKVLLAPPLSVKLQDTSPYQARGFSLVHLDDDQISRRLYWYDGRAGFVPEPARRVESRSQPHRGSDNWLAAAWSWLWDVGADKDGRLPRAAVAALALLAAFLTAVQVWEIPPPSTQKATPVAAAQATATAGGAGNAGAGGGAAGGGGGGGGASTPDLFKSNLGKTILAGLSGMFAVTALSSLWTPATTTTNCGATPCFDPKTYYLVLFVIFFLALLALSALFRASTEALRSRILLPAPPAGYREQSGWRRHRAWRWLVSLRTPVLVFGDTFFNVIQGKNQQQTKIFEDSIVDLQRSLGRATDKTARAVHRAVVGALKSASKQPDDSDVRVNVSVLADDQQTLYYVAWEPGSSLRTFAVRSVAWVAVRAGQARWWKKTYTSGWDATKISLYSGDALPPSLPPVSPDNKLKLTLGEYYQDRGPIDYDAFMVFPIPWRQRDAVNGGRRAGLHISFRTEELMDALWSGLEDPKEKQPAYDGWTQLLEVGQAANSSPPKTPALRPKEEPLQQVLQQALAVLAEVLRPFNETIFLEQVGQRK